MLLLPLHSGAAISGQATPERPAPAHPDAPVDPSSPALDDTREVEHIYTPGNPPSPEEEMRTPMPWQWPQDVEAEQEHMMLAAI